MWGDTEEEEEEAGAILMIFNCQGSNVEDQGLQHPEAPTPALTLPPPALHQDWWVWVGLGRRRVLGRRSVSGSRVWKYFILFIYFWF